MALTKQEVEKIGKLAHIALTEEDKEHYGREITTILKWVEQLSAVNTDSVDQLTSVTATALPMRKDEVTDGHCRDAVLSNAPKSEYGCFAVPRVME